MDRSDRPKDEIKILDCQVFVNPYEEVDEMVSKRGSNLEPSVLVFKLCNIHRR